MGDHPAWCSPAQVYYPPEIPTYLKKVYDLKPIAGTPTDEEVIGIHAVIQVTSQVAGVPEIHDSSSLMRLSDHLFSVQMARYWSKYSLLALPTDTVYIPPALPDHVPVVLEPVSGAPSDDEIIKVQEAVQAYQELRRFPSMFDAYVSMELSQHLFNIQMGKGANFVEVPQMTHLPSTLDVNGLIERSNQLAERFNQLLEHGTELLTRLIEPKDHPNSLTERFNQVLEQFTRFLERMHPSTQQSDRLAEQFNLLSERFNRLLEESNRSTRRANEISERANQLAEQSNQSSERSNQLSEKVNESHERLGDVMRNINRVLVRVQHAIVRNHKGNNIYALDCLVNEKGETVAQAACGSQFGISFQELWGQFSDHHDFRFPIIIDGAVRDASIPDFWLGSFLKLYGISEGFSYPREEMDVLERGQGGEARAKLSRYLSSCLG